MPRFVSSSSRDTVLALKKKRKTLAESVNEQLDPSARVAAERDAQWGDDGGFSGIVEDYDMASDGGSFGDSGSDGEDGANARRHPRGSKQQQLASSASRKRARAGSFADKGGEPNKLRRRGPLDSAFSEGKYAATPVNVEAAMDDIFGALDMADMDAEGEEIYEDLDGDMDEEEDDFDEDGDYEEGEDEASDDDHEHKGMQKQKKVRRAKDLSEEEYLDWLEKKQRKKRGAVGAGVALSGSALAAAMAADGPLGGEELGILEQLENLRQSQVSVLGASAAADSSGGFSSTDEVKARERTQSAIKHYIMLYSQLLRMRVRLQPAVTRAIGMPQYYALSLFTDAEGVATEDEDEDDEAGRNITACAGAGGSEDVNEAAARIAEGYNDVRCELVELLTTLSDYASGEKAPSSTTEKKKKTIKKGGKVLPTFLAINTQHQTIIKKASACVDLWGGKLVQANSAKLKTISQSLSKQIEAILATKLRLRQKVQKNRAHLAILAHPGHVACWTSAEAKTQRALQMAEGDIDAEVFDDADFVRELVKRGGAVASRLEQQLSDMNTELLPEREAARKGFHKLTKGKTVNYEPRPKIVGFMVANSYENSGRNDVVVQSLFQ